MSKQPSQTTTKPTQPKREPPTPEQLKRMASTPCKNILETGVCSHGKRCYFKHDNLGGGAVAFDKMSHQRVPPAQPAPPTQKDILVKILALKGYGEIAEYMVEEVDVDNQLAFLRVLLSANASLKGLKGILEQETVEEMDFSSRIVQIISLFEPFFDSKTPLGQVFSGMTAKLTEGTIDDRIGAVDGLISHFALPEGIEGILRAFDSQTASYAHALSLNPLDSARRNPDGKPDENLIKFLQTIPGLSQDPMFLRMTSSHSSVTKGRSVLTNKALFGFYDSFMAVRELDGLIEEQREKELAKQDHKRTVQQIVTEICCLKATNLTVSFKIMTVNSEVFREFVNKLDESEQAILVEHFSTFMSFYSTWMSMSLSKNGSISVESLNGAFEKFLGSFKLDKESRDIYDEFFEFYDKPVFEDIFELLNFSCPSPDVKSGDGEIASSDIFKRFLKAINGIFGSSVKASEKSFFESELANRGLVLLFVVMMSPDKFSKLVSAPFSKTYREMEKSPFKSFLYWLTQNATGKSKFNPDSFEWANLPSFFMTRNSDGEQEFSTKLLLQAIDETLSGFMSATNTGLNRVNVSQFLEDNALDWLFSFQEETCLIYVNDKELPLAVKNVLLRCYMVDESSEGARQVSPLKSLLSLPKDKIRELLKLLIEMPSSGQKELDFDSLYDLLGLKLSTQKKELAYSGLSEFLVMLHSLSLDSDLYSQAISMMSIFSYMQKHAKQSRYFMSMPSSVIFVLMTKQFPTLTYSEIANMIYNERYGHDGGTFFVHQQSVDNMLAALDERSSIKAQLEYFAIRSQTKKEKEESNTDQKRKVAIKECQALIGRFKMLFEEHCPLLHEFMKRALPYFMKPEYASKLFQGCGEQLEVSASSQSPEDALNERLKDLFKRFLMQAISQKKRQIFFDLSKTIKEIEETCTVPKSLGFYKFARHVSAWINLLNSLFENIGIQHRLSFDQIMKDFPDTKSKTLTSLEKATLMTHHVCSILNIPVPADDTDFVQHDKDSVVFWVVFQSLLATYNTELPKNETEVLKEVSVMAISILKLKTIIEESTTLDKVFLNGLPYMNSPLIRTFMIQILKHYFSSGNKGKLDSLLRSLQTFESKFTPDEKALFVNLFAYIEAPLPAPDISNLTSCVCKEEELLSQIIDSLREDGDWTDADVSVVISDEIVKRVTPRFKFVKAPVDSGMDCGGCAAVAVESESEEEEPIEASIEQELVEASVKPPFDATQLREFLGSDDRSSAITYLLSVELGEDDETLMAAICMLKNEEITCDHVIQALSQHGIFEED